MERKRRPFTPEFKSQAIQLARELKSPTQASRELGISESVIRVWLKKSAKESIS
jgi:transposase-like protein